MKYTKNRSVQFSLMVSVALLWLSGIVLLRLYVGSFHWWKTTYRSQDKTLSCYIQLIPYQCCHCPYLHICATSALFLIDGSSCLFSRPFQWKSELRLNSLNSLRTKKLFWSTNKQLLSIYSKTIRTLHHTP